MKKIFYLAVVAVSLIITLPGCGGDSGGGEKHQHNEKVEKKKIYHCPMHPQVTSDKPGVCPICHMDLVLTDTTEDEGMDMDSSGSMNMDVNINMNEQVLANISTVKAEMKEISRSIPVYSYIDFAEQEKRVITAKFDGRIEKLYINKTGDYISKGARLFDIYSPSLVQAQNEYLIALNNLNDNKGLLAAAKNKLLIMGMTGKQVEDLAASKEVKLILPYYSPYSGTVIEKKAEEGMYVNEGTVIYNIADMSTLWAISEVYESDISAVKKGSGIQLTLSSMPGETFNGRVDFIYPVVNPQTRTVKVRSVVANRSGLLKPNMYGQVAFSSNAGKSITVPEDAVLFTGKRNIVWVKTGSKTFQPREVKTGIKFNGSYQVLSGINEGDEVASSGSYLIDSESRLKSTAMNMQH